MPRPDPAHGLDRAALLALLDRPRIRRLLAALDRDGEETRIVGGAVRNALLGRPVTEVDFATTALPAVTAARAEAAGLRAVPTGIEHGTITVVVDGEPFEVTTLREDVETDGRHAVVRFGRDFATDAHRRDFTINALSLRSDGRLCDYTGGAADLAARRVRFIGDPATRIREDFLRILRFFRFHAEYAEGPIDASGLAAAIAGRHGLARLSRERVRAELSKLLVTRCAAEAVAVMADAGLYGLLLGGVPDRGRLDRVVAFEAREGLADPVRRLAGLGVLTGEDADRLRESLRLSNEEHRRLARYAGLVALLKAWALPLDRMSVRRLAAEHGLDALTDALAAIAGEPRPEIAAEGLDAFRALRSGAEPVPVFPLRGADLLAGGLPPGPHIGGLLEQARQAWLASGCPADEPSVSRLLARTLDHAPSLVPQADSLSPRAGRGSG
ncbi:MAG TPA: CCA tRNA nucleotidyltransferase [Microvirga sp.]|jgi:poly(A) polymerase|nr:CCA tRNA nucleotidyltransferase [Microvirga sp.]